MAVGSSVSKVAIYYMDAPREVEYCRPWPAFDESAELLAELKRRNVIRAAGLYLVGAWLLVQVAGTVLPMFGAPDWVPRTIVILLAIGFSAGGDFQLGLRTNPAG